ncbi:DNA-binding response regulator [filamentous cyanobacterium CCP5]|nr:DNA-binding response regulator [filamentous cyanobacterium CCP5]
MPLTVLVAEDDEGTRLALRDYLELEGYSVVVANNGEVALEQIYRCQPQLIVTDVAMPHMDGYELIRQVRQQPTLRLMPVIFLTAHTNTQDRVRGYQLGCDVYLAKPFELPEIAAIVRNLLERAQLMQAAWAQQVALNTAQQRAMAAVNRDEAILDPLLGLAGSGPDLTNREQDVLVLISDGLSNAQIGDRLYLSPRTVEKYVSSLLRKTDTSNRAELLRFAIDHHMVS